MTLRSLCLAAALAAAWPAGHASGSVWTARDLGVTATEAGCVARSVEIMRDFANLFGAGALSQGQWMVALDGIRGDEVHALITCNHDGQNTRATLVIWSAADTFTRLFAADRLRQLWDAAARRTR